MELIGAIVVALLAILGTAASRQITDEFKAWTPACVRYLIGCAVQQLSKDQRGRFAEEWSSHVSEVPGEIGKLVVAFGFLKAAWKMSPDLQRDVPFAVCKRAIDLFFSCLALALLAPLLIAFAISIKLETRGPVLFVQARRGYKDKIIRLAKFRTAYLGGNGNPQATRVGRLLRKLNLDELPQLLNVLVGDMSLVGPRPRSVLPEPSEGESVCQHDAKPGLTGWAQIHGLRETKAVERIEYDAWYAENRTILLDLKILFRTVVTVFIGPGPR
jgi:lipopolysaccharide/colanic/teichoic acid biosynthesis glycosyltransferase